MDEFKCSSCCLTFDQLEKYIVHKIEHPAQNQNDKGRDHSYVCILCPQEFARKSTMIHHYKIYHRLHALRQDYTQLVSSRPSVPNTKRQNRTSPSDLAESLNRSTFHVFDDLRLDSREKSTISEDSQSLIEITRFNDSMEETQKLDDFSFSFLPQSASSGAKGLLGCLHCAYKCNLLFDMATHMWKSHPDILKSSGGDDDVGTQFPEMDVIRASQYQLKVSLEAGKKQRGGTELDTCSPAGRHLPAGSLADPCCTTCRRQFKSELHMRKHIMVRHDKPRIFECEICGFTSSTRWKLKMHQITKHKSYQCPQCDFMSSTKAAIRKHTQLHSQGSFICDVCGKAYNLKDSLQKHKMVHDKSRPFACSFDGCTLRFKTERMRKGHLKTHYSTGEKHPCSECGYEFRHKHHLRRHLESAHGIPYIRRSANHVQQIETCEIPASPITHPIGEEQSSELALQKSNDASELNLAELLTSADVNAAAFVSIPSAADLPADPSNTTIIYIRPCGVTAASPSKPTQSQAKVVSLASSSYMLDPGDMSQVEESSGKGLIESAVVSECLSECTADIIIEPTAACDHDIMDDEHHAFTEQPTASPSLFTQDVDVI